MNTTYDGTQAGHHSKAVRARAKKHHQTPTKLLLRPKHNLAGPITISIRHSLRHISCGETQTHRQILVCVRLLFLILLLREGTHIVQSKVYLARLLILCCSPAASSKCTRPARPLYCKSHQLLMKDGSLILPPASPRPSTGRLYDHPANCCCIVDESIGPST